MGIDSVVIGRALRAAACCGALALLAACVTTPPASGEAGTPAKAPPPPVAQAKAVKAEPPIAGELETGAEQPSPPAEVEVAMVGELDIATDTPSRFGSYLAGRHARTRRDISSAADFYARALSDDPDNPQLLRRTFFLLVADGRVDDAVPLAEQLSEDPARHGVPTLVLALRDFKVGAADKVLVRLENAPRSGFNTLLLPLAIAWANAAQGQAEAAAAALEPLIENESFTPFRTYHFGLSRSDEGDIRGHPEIDRNLWRFPGAPGALGGSRGIVP
jgi:hypothetical protein